MTDPATTDARVSVPVIRDAVVALDGCSCPWARCDGRHGRSGEKIDLGNEDQLVAEEDFEIRSFVDPAGIFSARRPKGAPKKFWTNCSDSFLVRPDLRGGVRDARSSLDVTCMVQSITPPSTGDDSVSPGSFCFVERVVTTANKILDA